MKFERNKWKETLSEILKRNLTEAFKETLEEIFKQNKETLEESSLNFHLMLPY